MTPADLLLAATRFCVRLFGMRHALKLVTILLCLAMPATAGAQICAGSGSFASSPVHLGFDLTLAEGARGYHASLGVGGRTLFGGAAIAVLDPDEGEENATGLVLFVGAEFGGRRVFVCPIADIEFMKLPDIANVEVRGTAFAGGARLGIVAVDGPVRVIPTIGYFHAREKLTGTTAIDEGSVTRTFGLLQFGVGFAGEHFAFGPALMVAIDPPDTSTQFRIGFGILF